MELWRRPLTAHEGCAFGRTDGAWAVMPPGWQAQSLVLRGSRTSGLLSNTTQDWPQGVRLQTRALLGFVAESCLAWTIPRWPKARLLKAPSVSIQLGSAQSILKVLTAFINALNSMYSFLNAKHSLISLLFLISPAVSAQPRGPLLLFEVQSAAFGGNREAIAQLRRLGTSGNELAQVTLGMIYQAGRVVGEDQAESSRWFQMASERAIYFSRGALGRSREGDSIVKKYEAASTDFPQISMDWWSPRSPYAYVYAGSMFERGLVVQRDLSRAAVYYRRAADQDFPMGQFLLASLLESGRGIREDKEQATALTRRAAENEYTPAQLKLGLMLLRGQGVVKDVVAAAEWFQKAAQEGDSDAQFWLGKSYEAGEGVPQNIERAVQLFRQAAGKGNQLAQHYLGTLYMSGTGVERDPREAMYWCHLAAWQGNPGGQACLGDAYESGRGMPKDLVHAYMWLTFAAAKGWEGAATKLQALEEKMSPRQMLEAEKLIRQTRILQVGR